MGSPPHPAHQRVLEAAARKGVTLEIITVSQTTHTAEDAARTLDVDIRRIVKSVVFVAPAGDQFEPILTLVSGTNRVDVGRLAAVLGNLGVRRATAREATDATGSAIGGIPPIGHPQPMRVIMDPDLGRFQTVWAAAGTSDAVFEVAPGTLRMLANATVAPITELTTDPAIGLTDPPDPATAASGA